MKDFFNNNSYLIFSFLPPFMLFLCTVALISCEAKAYPVMTTEPSVYDLWSIEPDEKQINDICKYLVDNGWVSDKVDEETFHYEVTCILQQTQNQFDRVRPALALAMVAVESRYNPNALSKGGAKGLFQMIPLYHAIRLKQYLDKDIFYINDLFYDPLLNIMTGLDYIDYILGECDGNETAALMWYNEGPANGYSRWEEGKVSTYAKTVLNLAEELSDILPS